MHPALGTLAALSTLLTPAGGWSGPQRRPDRDTRGYFDSRGHRVWPDVFPN